MSINRRRPTPWIHRWSRLLIAAIALVGAVGTAYLTYTKLTGGSAACPAGGCERVLDSPYATVFGQPLTLFGFLGYASMGIMAIAPLLVQSQKDLQKRLESLTWPLLFLGATAMAIFSAYLMYILAFELKLSCQYCIGSAIFTWSMLVLTVIGREWEDIGQLIFQGFIVALVVFVGTLGVYSGIGDDKNAGGPYLAPSGQPMPGKGWQVRNPSGEAEIALAKHLSATGAKEYWAWWCPHCHEQKELFGQEASDLLPHVQCASNDPNSNELSPVCKSADIKSFPTWDIKGKRYSGVIAMDKLAEYSGFQGAQDFKYDFNKLRGIQPPPTQAPAIP
jgi:uncharacterized membrane protein